MPRRSWRGSVCLALFLAVAAFDRAAAQEPEGSPEYKKLVEDALDEFQRGSWDEAAVLFERAHKINPSARTLRGMGLTAYEARRYVDAISYLSAAIEDSRRPLTPKQRSELNGTLERAKAFVAHLRVKLSPRDAQVRVNGRELRPDASGDITLDPGVLDVEITAENYEPTVRRISLSGGRTEEMTVRLTPVRSAVAPPQHAPDSPVTTGSPSDTPFGPAPTPPPPPPPAPKGGGALTTLKWVTAGVALAAVGAGVGLFAYHELEASSYQRACSNVVPESEECAAQRRSTNGVLWTAPIVTLAIAGGLTALATTLFIVDATSSDEEQPPSARLGCGAGPGEIGVACRLTF